MFKYSVNSTWSDEDDCYVAVIPELPGVSGFGDTPEEAAADARLASEGVIEVLKEDGIALPAPKKLKTYSGQTRLRMPVSLHERLALTAEREGVSFNTFAVSLLEGKSAREDAFFQAQKSIEQMNVSFLERAGQYFYEMIARKVAAKSAIDLTFDFNQGDSIACVPSVQYGHMGMNQGYY